MEAHHLIPMSRQGGFSYSLDVPANIIPLCPNCHRKIHHATEDERNKMIKRFFSKRAQQLNQAGIIISLDELLESYKN